MTQKELQLILQEGEGYKIEFKENTSGLDREIVAFANASGAGYLSVLPMMAELRGLWFLIS